MERMARCELRTLSRRGTTLANGDDTELTPGAIAVLVKRMFWLDPS